MKKNLYSRKILSMLLTLAVIMGCVSMAFFGVSAEAVDYVISDDFTVGGKATVFGKATDRSNVWSVSDYSNVILGTATTPTNIASAYETVQKTKGTSVADVLSLGAQTYGIFSFKDYKTTDVIKSFEVDLGALNSVSRNDTIGICFFYDPVTGQAFYLAPHAHSAQGLQFAIYYSKTGADGTTYRLTQNNNGYNPGNSATFPGNSANGIWVRVGATYTYEANGNIKSIAFTIKYYSDSSYENLIVERPTGWGGFGATDTGNSGLGKFFANTGLTAATKFNVGIILPDANADYACVDRVAMTYSRELGAEYFVELANEFVAAHKTNILLDTAEINSTNAVSVLETVNAYNLLADEVKAVLTNIDVDGTAMDVGAKIITLNSAAAPFVPTEKQIAFETYYNDNGIGDKTAIDDAAVIEQAIKLYGAIEDTHKGNVADKYAKIINVIKATYIVTGATTENVTIPSIQYANLKNEIMKAATTDAYVTEITGKINAHEIFNDSGKALNIKFFNQGDSYLGLEIRRGSDSAGGSAATAEGLKISRILSSSTIATNAANFGTGNYPYQVNAIGSNLGLNANTTETDKAKHRALFTDDNCIINESNKYLNFAYRYTVEMVSQDAGVDFYKINVAVNMAIYYDANGNNTLDEGEIALLDFGYLNASKGLFYVKVDSETSAHISSFDVTGDIDTFAKDFVATKTLNTTVELTPAEEFVAEYSNVFNSATPAGDATLEMYLAYEALDTDVKAELTDSVEEALTKAGVRPSTDGATIRTNTDQNIVFYTDKPAASTNGFRIKEMGSVFCGLGYAIENGLSVTKGETGTISGGKEYAAGDTIDDEILIYLSGTNVSGKDNWSTYIVARSYIIWTDGTNDIIIYSANENANNPDKFDSEFDSSGMVIRCVNDIIKTIAGAVKTRGNADLYEANKGAETKYGNEYAGVSYADLTTLDDAGLVTVEGVRNAEATLKMLIAYQNLISAVANQ